MDQVFLTRTKYEDKQTLGVMHYLGSEICVTLELAWLDNNQRVSCIPLGKYKVVRRQSPKYGMHFHLTNVPGRSLILIHQANYHYQLLGCIAVGQKHIDINKDGYLDVTNSKRTMTKLLKLLPKEFELIIA